MSTAGLFSAPAQLTSVCGLASLSIRVTFSFPRCLLQASYRRFLSAETLSASSVGKEHRKARGGPENRHVVRWRSFERQIVSSKIMSRMIATIMTLILPELLEVIIGIIGQSCYRPRHLVNTWPVSQIPMISPGYIDTFQSSVSVIISFTVWINDWLKPRCTF